MGKAGAASAKAAPAGRSIMSFFGASKSSARTPENTSSPGPPKAGPEGVASVAAPEVETEAKAAATVGVASVATPAVETDVKATPETPSDSASALSPAKPAATGKAKAKAKGKKKAPLSTPVAAAVHAATPSGAAAPDAIQTAHKLIDLAKDGAWDELYSELNCVRELVNVRPAVREYGVLHQAAFHGNIEVVNVLIDTYGADPRIVTKQGETVVDVAKAHGNVAVAESLAARVASALEEAETSPEAKRPRREGPTPEKISKKTPVPIPSLTPDVVSSSHNLLDLAKRGEWGALCEALDKRPELINVRPAVREYGIIHQAVYGGDEKMVRLLIDKYGADLKMQTKSGESAVNVAKEQGHAHLLAALSSSSDHEAAVSDDADDPDFDFVQMPDGSWKVVPKQS